MASTPIVFEVMIHCAGSELRAARLLSRRLARDGMRAGICDPTKPTSTQRTARHSLLLVGAPSRDIASAVATERFDLVLADSSIETTIRDDAHHRSYASLLEALACRREAPPLNEHELRRATAASYDAIAGQFTDVWYDTIPGEAIETFAKHLPRGAKLLDVGCGPGHHAKYLSKAGFDVVGLDFSKSMVDIARRKNWPVPFIHGDALSYPLPREHFGGVWSAVMLNHVPVERVPMALGNLVATLHHGGFIGLNFQVGRPSERVERGLDRRYFEYPVDEQAIVAPLEALGVRMVATHFATTTRNLHGLDLKMHFATVVGQKGQTAFVRTPTEIPP